MTARWDDRRIVLLVVRDFAPQPKSRSDAYVRTKTRPDVGVRSTEIRAAKCPTEFNGQKIQPLEGRSLVPAFADKPIERDAIFWEHEGNAAVRVGDWKLVPFGRNGTWELYDLKADRTEQHNLAAQHPDRANELAARWHAWAERAQVKPYPGQNDGKIGDGKKKANKKNA